MFVQGAPFGLCVSKGSVPPYYEIGDVVLSYVGKTSLLLNSLNWLAERNFGSVVADWVGEQSYCINFSPPSFDVTIPLWGIILVPATSIVTGFIKKTDAWNQNLRLVLSALGLWLHLAIPLYFLWLAGRS